MAKSYRFLFLLKILIISLYFNIFLNTLRNKTQIKSNFEEIKNDFLFCYNISFNNSQKYLSNINIQILLINYSFSFSFHRAKIEYKIAFYDKNKNLINPSHLNLYYKLHIFCQTNYFIENKNIKSLANIYKNKLYYCIEYFNINEKIDFGIEIYKNDKYFELIKINLFNDNLINYNNNSNINNMEFDPFFLINQHINLENKIDKEINNSNIINKTFLLKQSYISSPQLSIKSDFARKEEVWYFKNIFNNYFCYCKYSNNSKCLYEKIPQKCKYKLYLNIIDNNRNSYINKTDYLLADFSLPETAPCEAFLVFKEMIKQNLNAHYMTQRDDIFKEYNDSNLYKNFPIIYGPTYINGDFLEKYLDIFLKLKAVISGAKIFSIDNLFFNIEYITYICLGHGISYLKDFLYIDYYSQKVYNKICLPNSNLLISNAIKFGWNNNNIIKIGLPRWDIFINYEKNSINNDTKNFSIFIMFTWRDIKKFKKISKYYFKNVLNLINNKDIIKNLKLKDILLYFTLHHNMEEYKNMFLQNNYIRYINQEKINECLKKVYLVVTDFSSIIFDIILRHKPYILYIPDSEDPNLIKIYNKQYYDVINGLKNGNIIFENKFFNLNETIKKIIFYIKNNFELEPKLEQFYQSFQLEGGNNTIKIINYLKDL